MAIKWTASTLAVPYTEAVGRNVVNALLQFESLDPPYTPATVWALLKKRPVLPPICMGRSRGTMDCVVRRVRELGDIEILTLYFLLLWSEWNIIHPEGLANMRVSIREDFADIGMRQHREELIERLDQVLGKLEPESEYLKQRSPWIDKDPQRTRGQYQELKGILLEVDREATEILTSTPSRPTELFDPLTPVGIHRISLNIYMCPPVPVVACLRHSLPQFNAPIIHGFISVTPSSIITISSSPLPSPLPPAHRYILCNLNERAIYIVFVSVPCRCTKLSTVVTVLLREVNSAEKMSHLKSYASRPYACSPGLSIILAGANGLRDESDWYGQMLASPVAFRCYFSFSVFPTDISTRDVPLVYTAYI